MQRMVAVIARWGLWIALGLALLVRIAVLIAIPQPMVSDALAYFHMADGAAHGQPMTDIFGQYAFYSPGYPLLLAGPFAGFGSTLLVAQVVNLLCALGLIALAWLLTKRLSRSALAPPLAALALAVWLPSVLGAQIVEKENLSSLLLIGYTILLCLMARRERPALLAGVAGLIYGFSLLVGGSVMLTVAGFGAFLRFSRAPFPQKAGAIGLFALGAMAILTPWLVHVHAMIGKTTLSTNAPFNLYLGNNPTATGWFESIADTPLGPAWHQRSVALGEAGTAAWLNREAVGYITAHPIDTIQLGFRKLAYFWFPHGPHVAGDRPSRLVAMERFIADAQYLLVLVLAAIGMFMARLAYDAKRIVLTIIASFWLIHGITYIIPRYHDPVMPLLICFAAAWIAQIFERKRTG